MKNPTVRHIIIKLFENNDEEKILFLKKKTCYRQGNKDDNIFLFRDNARVKATEQYL